MDCSLCTCADMDIRCLNSFSPPGIYISQLEFDGTNFSGVYPVIDKIFGTYEK